MNIPCEVILDLIPLVRDGASSEEAKRMVEDHVAQCAPCRAEYESYSPKEKNAITLEDKRIIRSIKMNITVSKLFLIAIVIALGMFLMFHDYTRMQSYNYLLMPAVGALSYFSLRHSRILYSIPPAVFVITYCWRVLTSWRDSGFNVSVLQYVHIYALTYAVLTLAGIGIAFLLRFAFRPGQKAQRRHNHEEA